MTLSLPRLALAVTILLGLTILTQAPVRAQYLAPEGRLICANVSTQAGNPAQVTVLAQGSDGQPLANEVVSFTVPGGGTTSGITGPDGRVTLLLTNTADTTRVDASLRGFGCTATVFSDPEVSEVLSSVFTPPIVGDAGLAGSR